MNRRAFLAATTAWLLTPQSQSQLKDLEAQIPSLLKSTNVPGLSLAVFKNNRILWLQGFGVTDRASGAGVDSNTLFEAASMSKPVFAYLVLKLCEQGTLSLDTPLTTYTSRQIIEGDPRINRITARHILSHSSGLVPDWRSPDQPLRIAFNPGERWSYSGEGYFYLQSVVTDLIGHTDPKQCDRFEAGVKVCATDFGETMESRVIKPLGMTSSSYVLNPHFAKRRARPHDVNGNPLPYRPSRAIDLARYGAAGGLITTPADYAKFLMQIIDPMPQDDHHLSAASLREMTTPQIEVSKADDYTIAWGLGWRIASTPKRVYFGHDGANPGFQCIAEACAADRTGFVLMTNSDNGKKLLEKLAPEISRRLHS